MSIRRTNGLKTNYHQFMPYPSRDMTELGNASIYQSLKNVLGPLFDWLDVKVGGYPDCWCASYNSVQMLNFLLQLREIMPDVYNHLEGYSRLLPCNNQALSAPFLGLVINLNVATAAHRDSKDERICLVLAVGDFEGGELVLYEPGLVIPLRNGDFVLFPSCDLTHFNLHYIGRRASIVLHTDREISKWHNGRNGWSDNIHFV